MKNQEIVAIVNVYTAIHSTGEGLKLPAKVAWIRRLNMDKLFRAKGLIDEAMKEIAQKYSDDEHSTPAEEGNGRTVKPEYIPEYAKEQAEILAQDTDIEIRKVNIEELGDIQLTDAEMDTIAFMLEGGD